MTVCDGEGLNEDGVQLLGMMGKKGVGRIVD